MNKNIFARLFSDAFDYAIYLLVRGLTALLEIPSYPTLCRMAEWLGRLGWYILPSRRNLALENVRLALGLEGEAARALVRRSFVNMTRVFLEIPYFIRPDRKPEDLVDLENFDRVKPVLARGKGIIFITGHIGNWELLGRMVARLGIRFSALAKRQHNRFIDAWINAIRARAGITIIRQSRLASINRRIVDTLKANEAVGFIADQYISRGLRVPFFGLPTPTATGPARMSRITGASVFAGYMVFENGRYKLVAYGEMETIPGATPDEGLYLNTRQYNAFLETVIRKHPDQWFWFHKRFRKAALVPAAPPPPPSAPQGGEQRPGAAPDEQDDEGVEE